MNIVTGRITPSTAVNVDKSVEIGKAQLEMFEKDWPAGLQHTYFKKIVTTEVSKKSVRLGTKMSMTYI